MEFKHFLITRYNIPVKHWVFDKNRIEVRSSAWLEHRLQLFTTYCLPSVMAQTNQQFTWLIYCDSLTPTDHLHQLSASIQGHANYHIRLVDREVDSQDDIVATLSQAGTDFVISSRLDNDDALGRDYIRIIQDHFVPRHKTLINVLNGHGYNFEKCILTRLTHIRFNSFTSFIEACSPDHAIIGIRGFPHDEIPLDVEVVDIPVSNGWLKLFHERNLKSRPFGRPLFSNMVYKYYGLKPDAIFINYARTLGYLCWWLGDGFNRKILGKKKAVIDNSG